MSRHWCKTGKFKSLPSHSFKTRIESFPCASAYLILVIEQLDCSDFISSLCSSLEISPPLCFLGRTPCPKHPHFSAIGSRCCPFVLHQKAILTTVFWKADSRPAQHTVRFCVQSGTVSGTPWAAIWREPAARFFPTATMRTCHSGNSGCGKCDIQSGLKLVGGEPAFHNKDAI